MDHAEAVRLKATEKYVLGELPAELRDAYEAHYFECAECAIDVQAAATFVDGARDAFAAEARRQALVATAPELGAPVPAGARPTAGWFHWRWLRPAFALPVFAALLVMVAYQNTVTIPQLKRTSSQGAGLVYGASVRLAETRGGAIAGVTIRPGEGLLLDFDFIPSAPADSYSAQLRDPSGHVLVQTKISADQANQALHLPVPPGLLRSPGQYQLVFTGSASAAASRVSEVQRLIFTVAFRQ